MSPATLVVALVLAAVSAVPARAMPLQRRGDSGYTQFVRQQVAAAKAATRARDWPAVDAAWLAVLELDPASTQALEGLADAAKNRKDADGELVALLELDAIRALAAAAGNATAERDRGKAAERIARLDPHPGEAQSILDEYSDAMATLGEAYLEQGWYANAQLAWSSRLSLCAPGSEAHAQAVAALARVLKEGGDDVAQVGLAPGALDGGKDETWIEDHDKRTRKWSKATQWETPHYRIKTNAGWRLGAGAAAVMERVHAFYREVWGIMPDPPPARPPEGLREITVPPIEVNIYGDHEEYIKRSGAPEWSGGVFTGSEVATYDHGASGSYRATYNTLFHEASHQFMNVAVGSVPSFVNEGVACLFEGIEILSNGSIRRDLPVKGRLGPLANELDSGQFLGLAEVMGGKDARSNEPEFYKYRWGVFYFLRMYVDEQGEYVYRDALQSYIYEFKKGSPGDMVEHFTEHFIEGVKVPGITTFDDFEKVWRQWIIDLQEELRTNDKRLDDYKKRAKLASVKKEYEAARRFFEKALDIDPDDLDAIYGLAKACGELDQDDRAVGLLRKFLDRAPEGDKRRREAAVRVGELDEHDDDFLDARRVLAGGMSGLARDYEDGGMPLVAMHWARAVLDVDPLEPSTRALVGRLERETGRSIIRWQRLFNGFDIEGWYAGEGEGNFLVEDGALVSDWARVDAGAQGEPAAGSGVSLYRTLFLDRPVDGDWTLEARIQTTSEWEIVGLCFGTAATDDFEAIVLRKTGGPSGRNNVDFGTFGGDWSFRGDGSMKANYDPVKGVTMRIEVRGRQVSVTLDGELVKPIVGGKPLPSMKYPLGALRGDVGLITSKGTTRFTGLRLLGR